jgi:arylsulfatase A-like enzyme
MVPRRSVLLAILLALAACGRDSAPRPNVILIVIDTLRADHVFDADGSVATPRIDELARDGVAFPLAFSHTSWTLPSHAALFSSRPPSETGVLINAQRVPDDLPLLAEWMSGRGYRTEAVVSLCSLIPAGELVRLDRGFEAFDSSMERVMNPAARAIEHAHAAVERVAADARPFFLFAHFADPHQPYTAHGTVELPAEVRFGGAVVGAVPNLAGFAPFAGTLELAPGDNALEVRADAPFTLRYVGATTAAGERLETRFNGHEPGVERAAVLVNPTDAPLVASVELWAWDDCTGAEARRRYRLEVEYLDRYVGELLDDLRARGLYDDALIVFTADHGEGLGEHGLLDHGLNVFDEQIHVPLIVKLPAGDAGGRAALARSAAGLARHVDVVPTILQVVDLPMLPGATGLSLLEDGERIGLAEMHALSAEDNFALRDARWKLFYGRTSGRFVLFDLAADPDEMRPIADVDPARFGAWMERLRTVAKRSPDAKDVDRDADEETRARMKAMGYF